MGTLLTILILLASVLLVLVVLIQNPKGGGLSTDFGAAHQLGGVQKTNDSIEKATWGLAGIIGVLSIVMTMIYKGQDAPVQQEEATQTEQPVQAPAGEQGGAQ